MKKLILLFSILPFVAGLNTYAQSTDYSLADQSTLTIKGTSTLHDWECSVDDFSAEAGVSEPAADQPLIDRFELTARVESIECGKGAMNKKTYGALKEKKHPEISFTVSDTGVTPNSGSEQTFDLNVEGELTIAGVTRIVSFPVTGQLLPGNQYQFSGSYLLNMRDYEVDPPSAVFGTIRAGEEVEVIFDITLTSN